MPKKIKYNPADRMADLAMMRMQGKIKKVYAEAEQDISKKLDNFTRKFRKKDAQYRADLEAGKITQADYDSWRRGQMFQGEQWKAAKKEMTDQIYRANKTAAGIINGERRVVFQQNANYSAYQIEKNTHGAVNFELYDSATVTRLLKEDKKLLPEYKVNQRKDYKWNNRKVNNAVTQSIIQGESIDDLSSRLTKSLESGNRSSMLSFARTAMTGAQNAGRVEAMHDAEDMGIRVQKRWIATLDSRTRDTHAELDGQVVDVDEPFEVDGMEIMYPGDPNADPSLVYNCRCTLGWEYPGVATGIGTRANNETGEDVEGMTYKQWEQSKHIAEYADINNQVEVEAEAEYHSPFEEISESWGDYRIKLEEDARRQIENEIYANRGSMTVNEYWRSLIKGTQKNERIEQLLGRTTENANKEQLKIYNVSREKGVELYRRFVEGDSLSIHEMAGFDFNGNYDEKRVKQEELASLDSIFAPMQKQLHVYKGVPIPEDQLDSLEGIKINHSYSSTSTDKVTATDYMMKALDTDDCVPLLLDITIDEDVPVADAQELLGTGGMKAFEKEITVCREVVWEYSEIETHTDRYGEEYYTAKVRVKKAGR